MKLLMEPGGALLTMAVLAFVTRFLVKGLPLVGGILNVVLLFAVVFGLVGGAYLTYLSRRQPV